MPPPLASILLILALLWAPAVTGAQSAVGCWPMDGNANDTSGNSNNGSLVGSPTFTTGQRGQAISLDGAGQYVSVAHQAALNLTTDFTIALWVKRDNTARTEGILAKSNGSVWDYELYTIAGNPGQLTFYADGKSPSSVGSLAVIPDTNWHHIAVTRSGTTVTFWFDGTASNTPTMSGALNTNSVALTIGSDQAFATFDGLIDDVALYTTALDSGQLSTLMSAGCDGVAPNMAFDASSAPTAGTSDLSWTHTPVGTPAGVIVLVAQNVGVTDEVVSVTYGGTALGEVTGSPLLHTTGAEDGALYGYFLGSSIPTGAQTVLVDVNATGSSKQAVAITLTAIGNTTIDTTATLDSGSATNPSVSLSTTASTETFIAAVLHSGLATMASITPGADYTTLPEHDFGAQVAGWMRRTALATGGSVTVDWTAATEEAGILAVAVKLLGTAIVPVVHHYSQQRRP